jgi:predicted Zn finger-like uncharacterized protein
MRIVCDSCGKKYVISDDKVRGKLFKIRCKRCSHVIVVQGVEDPPATAEDDRTHVYSASAEQIAADMVTQSPPSVSGYQWHYVLDGEQAGPVSETEIAALYRDGIVNGDSYLWREGIDDWVHLRDVPVFADLVGGATLGPDSFDDDDGPELAIGNGAGNGSGYGDNMFGEDEATQIVSSASIGGGFGAAAAADVGVTAGLTSGGASARRSAERAPIPEPEEPSWQEPPVSSGAGDDDDGLFVGFDAPAAAPTPAPVPVHAAPTPASSSSSSLGAGFGGAIVGGSAASSLSRSNTENSGVAFLAETVGGGKSEERDELIGARSENSVLFSLDMLGGDKDDEDDLPTTEGSGLIDIKALAASHSAGAAPKQPTENSLAIGSGAAPAAPSMMPMGRRQSNGLLYALVGAGALIIAGLVVAIVLVVTGQGTTEGDGEQASGTPDPAGTAGAPAVSGGSGAAAPTQVAAAAPEDTDTVATARRFGETEGTRRGMELQLAARDVTTAIALAGGSGSAEQVVAAATAEPTPERERPREREREREPERERERESSGDSGSSSRREERAEPERVAAAEREEEPSGGRDVDSLLAEIRNRRGDEGESSPRASDRGSSRSSEPAREETPASSGSTLAESLSGPEVSRAIRRYNRRVNECHDGGEAVTVSVEMTIHGNGRVASARATSGGGDVANCVVGVVRDMRFPEFSGAPMTVERRFRLQ